MKPATPLPWELDDESQVCGNNRIVSAPQIEGSDWKVADLNAAYIVHASNAYPRLVQAMRDMGAGYPSNIKSVNDATALLRELGEIK